MNAMTQPDWVIGMCTFAALIVVAGLCGYGACERAASDKRFALAARAAITTCVTSAILLTLLGAAALMLEPDQNNGTPTRFACQRETGGLRCDLPATISEDTCSVLDISNLELTSPTPEGATIALCAPTTTTSSTPEPAAD